MDWDVWGAPLIVLGSSLVVAAVWLFSSKEEKADVKTAQSAKAELLAEKKQYMEALQELEADRLKMDEAAYLAQKETLISAAAVVLQNIEGETWEEEHMTHNPSPSAEKSAMSGWAIFAASTVFFVVLGGLLAQYSAPRQEGQVMTGGSQETVTASRMEQARQERLSRAQEQLSKTPEDIDANNILAYDALLQRDFSTAMKHMETVRGLEPNNPEMLVHLGILQISVGMPDRAEEVFNKALEVEPEMGKALLWRGVLNSNLGNKEEALKDIKVSIAYLELPEEKLFAQSLLDELDKPPPILAGTINMSDVAVGKGTLFVIVRRAKDGGGPPVAVQRAPRAQFPFSFAVGRGDMVMGGAWPEEVWIEARLDSDGNAMTKSDEDWVSELKGPISGSNLELSLMLKGGQGIQEPTMSSQTEMISGRISIESDADVKGTLFLIARRAEVRQGPPAAVRKFDGPTFPLDFDLGTEHLMMGGAWPSEVWVEARLDSDGNAMTKSDEDWVSELKGPIVKGDAVELILTTK